MMRRGPTMALEKVRRKKLYYPPLVRLVVLFFLYLIEFFIFKESMKENLCWKYTETGDKCNSVIRTMEEDWAWQDM